MQVRKSKKTRACVPSTLIDTFLQFFILKKATYIRIEEKSLGNRNYANARKGAMTNLRNSGFNNSICRQSTHT